MSERLTVFRGGNVVDTSDGSVLPHQDVHVAGDRIVQVSPSAQSTLPDDALVIDIAGKYVVPGFVDMHAHPLNTPEPAGSLELLVAHGVTGFRQMAGSADLLRRRADGTLLPALSPRLVAMAGPLLTPLNTRTPAVARATVREQVEMGADFIKAGMTTRALFFEAQDEANRAGIPFLGHLPQAIDVERVSGEGMRSIEHLGVSAGLLSCCSHHREEIESSIRSRREFKAPPFRIPFLEAVSEKLIGRIIVLPTVMSSKADVADLERIIASFDGGVAAELASTFVANETWQVPTLIRSRTMRMPQEYAASHDGAELTYVSPKALKSWNRVTSRFEKKFAGPPLDAFRSSYDLLVRLTGILDDVGVKMLAGSDCNGAAWVVPGHSFHQELDELASAGISPLRVLQMATRNAAEFLGATATMGTVADGRDADLVFLDANPIESVENLHGVAGVVLRGRYLDARELDEIKHRVAAAPSVH